MTYEVGRKFEFVGRMVSTGYEMKEPGIKLPERNTAYSAGYDFYNPEEVVIEPGKIVYVKTGIKAAMLRNEYLMLVNRSSNPKKKGLVLANGCGIVDADYYNNDDNEGEIAFAFMNITNEPIKIEVGDKLGQGIFMEYLTTLDDKANGERTGGFGSTGK